MLLTTVAAARAPVAAPPAVPGPGATKLPIAAPVTPLTKKIVAKRNYAIAKRTGSLSLLKSPSKSAQTFSRQNYQINFIINT